MHKVSDLIADFLKYHKIETVFGIIGSANSHIFDSINSLGYTKVVNVHHEQVAVMAMGAYFRASGKISATIVTAGAGSANAITGIISNWADSIPGIIISGNESSFYIESHKKLRMYGTQGFDIASMVKKVTKYSKCLLKKEDIYSELNKCIQISLEDRKGPVLLDIPFDIQASSVKPKNWKKISISANNNKTDIKFIINEINSAERPLVLGGHGIRLSNSVDLFKKFINNSNLPTTLSWSAIDILDSENKNFYGRFGLYGQRAANLIVQNCDLLIVIGSRLALPQTGYNYEKFVRDGDHIS